MEPDRLVKPRQPVVALRLLDVLGVGRRVQRGEQAIDVLADQTLVVRAVQQPAATRVQARVAVGEIGWSAELHRTLASTGAAVVANRWAKR